ncbi:MAG: hypothetical protein QM790_01835 [Nibricoccus sp.]
MNRKLFIVVLFALCSSSYGQTAEKPNASSTTSALEEARRDLRDLPAMERSRDLLPKPALGSAAPPSFDFPGAAKPESKENAAPSPTWLQDALDRAELEKTQQRARDNVSSRRLLDDSKTPAAPDPFAKLIEQWLSPRDLELLRPTTSGPTTFGPRDVSKAEKGSRRDAQPADVQTQVPSPVAPIMPLPRNPYIEDAEAFSSPAQTTPQAGQLRRAEAPRYSDGRALAPMDSPADVASKKPTKPAVSPKPPASTPPPTAPVVDDRKYFPQLRRF